MAGATRTVARAGAAGVRRVVFSSTCAVYGLPARVPIDETQPPAPVNPYGETKLAFERALTWYARAHGLRHISLRYFNACGAEPEHKLGERRLELLAKRLEHRAGLVRRRTQAFERRIDRLHGVVEVIEQDLVGRGAG